MTLLNQLGFSSKEERKCFKAFFDGQVTSALYQLSGIQTLIHELGHSLAVHMTYQVPKGLEPVIEVDAFTNITKISQSKSLDEGLERIRDFFLKGSGGMTSWHRTAPTKFGESLGEDGRLAFVAMAGSLPPHLVNGGCVAAGAALWESNRPSSIYLLSFGLTNHLSNCIYPWSAVAVPLSEMGKIAAAGHDFVKFAVCLSKITGVSPKVIAVTTAILFTLSVPAVGLLVLMNQQNKLSKIRVQLQQEISSPKMDREATKVERILGHAQIVVNIISLTSSVLRALGESFLPAAMPIATLLGRVTPILQLVSLLSTGYQTYSDLKSTLPRMAKMLSVAHLVVSIVSATFICIGVLLPGSQIFIILGVVLGSVGGPILSFAKYWATLKSTKTSLPSTASMSSPTAG